MLGTGDSVWQLHYSSDDGAGDGPLVYAYGGVLTLAFLDVGDDIDGDLDGDVERRCESSLKVKVV